MGRKPLPPTEKRSTEIRVRVTDKELEELEAGAAQDGLQVSSWVRMVALRAAKRG